MYTLMIVDDEKGIVDGLKIIITRVLPECMIVAVAYDGENGFHLGMEYRPQIIVTDIKMFKEDGLSMIERLQQAGCNSYFVILSAYHDFNFARKGMSLGVRYYLTKPLEELDLQQCVRQIIMDIERARGSEADIISEIIDAAQRTRSNSKDTPLSNGEFQKEYLP